MEIALFGTSADPPSIAHQQILRWLGEHFAKCVVWVADNPFKQHQAGLAHRLAMMELTIRDLGSSYQNIELHPEIADRRTIYTVEKAKELWQGADFYLVVGADILPQLPKWYCAQDLLAQVKLLVIPRHGIEITPELLAPLGTTVTIAPATIAPVSSTAYRHYHDPSLVVPAVAKYIEQAGLYQSALVSEARK
ncbi:MAG: nicotinate-nucleotide adenylyltransferase [Pseudanabaenaceae cyanobacterium]